MPGIGAIIVFCGPPCACGGGPCCAAAPALSSVSTCWQVCIISPADWKRRPGSLSSAFLTMATTDGGRPAGSGGTSERRCICSTAIGLSSLKGTLPVSIS